MMMAKILWDIILLISGTFSISLVLDGSLFSSGPNNSTQSDANVSFESNSTALPYFPTNGSSPASPTNQTAIATNITGTPPVKKFVAAAVRSHFDDCPDSHRHFCFHGACRFLILEETPACVCHQGFVGIRCEHADLLAVVATNQSQNTITSVLVLCVISCALMAVLVTLLHCWWRQLCRRRRYAQNCAAEKNSSGVSYWPSESVV